MILPLSILARFFLTARAFIETLSLWQWSPKAILKQILLAGTQKISATQNWHGFLCLESLKRPVMISKETQSMGSPCTWGRWKHPQFTGRGSKYIPSREIYLHQVFSLMDKVAEVFWHHLPCKARLLNDESAPALPSFTPCILSVHISVVYL